MTSANDSNDLNMSYTKYICPLTGTVFFGPDVFQDGKLIYSLNPLFNLDNSFLLAKCNSVNKKNYLEYLQAQDSESQLNKTQRENINRDKKVLLTVILYKMGIVKVPTKTDNSLYLMDYKEHTIGRNFNSWLKVFTQWLRLSPEQKKKLWKEYKIQNSKETAYITPQISAAKGSNVYYPEMILGVFSDAIISVADNSEIKIALHDLMYSAPDRKTIINEIVNSLNAPTFSFDKPEIVSTNRKNQRIKYAELFLELNLTNPQAEYILDIICCDPADISKFSLNMIAAVLKYIQKAQVIEDFIELQFQLMVDLKIKLNQLSNKLESLGVDFSDNMELLQGEYKIAHSNYNVKFDIKTTLIDSSGRSDNENSDTPKDTKSVADILAERRSKLKGLFSKHSKRDAE